MRTLIFNEQFEWSLVKDYKTNNTNKQKWSDSKWKWESETLNALDQTIKKRMEGKKQDEDDEAENLSVRAPI